MLFHLSLFMIIAPSSTPKVPFVTLVSFECHCSATVAIAVEMMKSIMPVWRPP